MRQLVQVVQAPDGAVDLLTSLTQDWESDPHTVSRLRGLFANVLQYIASDDFRASHGDCEARVIIGISYDLSDDAAAEVSRFMAETGIPVEVRMLAFQPPPMEPLAVALHEEGIERYRAGDFSAAIATIERAIAVADGNAEPRIRAGMSNSLGMVHHAAGNLEEAVGPLCEALALRRSCGDERGEGITENNLGLVCMDLGRLAEARAHFEASLRLREAVGDTAGALKTQTNLSALERLAGEEATRHGALDEAMAAITALNEEDLDPGTAMAAAAALEAAGRHGEAAASYQAAAHAAAAQEDRALELNARDRRAQLLASLGRYAEARSELDNAEQIAIELEARRDHTAILGTRAGVLHQMGKRNEALHDAQLAVALARDIGDSRLTGSALNTLAVQYGLAGLHDLALDAYDKSLCLAKDNDNARGAVIAGANAALELERGDEAERAGAYARDAIATARTALDEDGVAYGCYALGRSSAAIGDTSTARTAFEEAAAAVESGRSGIGGDDLKSSYFGSVNYVYADYVEFLVDIGDSVHAFEIADAAKSRWLADQLGSGPLPAPAGFAPDDPRLVSEATLLAELGQIDRTIHHDGDGASSSLSTRKSAVRRRLGEVWSALEADAPDYVAGRRGIPTRLDDVHRVLGATSGLVEFFALRDEVVAFVVTPFADSPALVRTGVETESLQHRIDTFGEEVAGYEEDFAVEEHWQQSLGGALIKPVLPHLGGLDLVYFSAHRELHALPLHAVRVSGAPLTEQVAVAYAPSASVLRLVIERDRARGTGRRKDPLVLAYTEHDDERGNFEGEAHDVAGLLGTSALTGRRASSLSFRELGPDADVIHLSCHGLFDAADPLSSSVILADGPMTARDIMGLQLQARLVTISACSTGVSGVAPGDELMGLTRAFLYAGASAVIVTLWDVDPEAALMLMTSLYDAGVASQWSSSPADLLQAAMRTVRAAYEHTYYWAPFIVVGNAGQRAEESN